MSDDLKERLLGDLPHGLSDHDGREIVDAEAVKEIMLEAADRIAALEAQLAAAEARRADRHRAGWDAAMKAAAGSIGLMREVSIWHTESVSAAIRAIPYPGDEG